MSHRRKSTLAYDLVDRRNPRSCILNSFEKNIFSQSGEDGVISKIFELIGLDPLNAWCCEFGAWDGLHLSNTANLIKNHSWNGIYIEGNKSKFQQLKRNFKNNKNVYLINEWVDWMPGSKHLIDELLSQTPTPLKIDFLSIDIDGNDYHVFDSIHKYRPRVICVEFNSTIPNDILYIQENSPDVRFGSSLRAFVELGKSKHYELCYANILNGIFIDKEEFIKLKIPSNTLDEMFVPRMDARLFQGYNGEVVMAGLDRLYWDLRHIKPSSSDFQYLKKYNRNNTSRTLPNT